MGCSSRAAFHRLQLGSHVGLLLLQQRCTLFHFPRFFFLLSAVECQTGTAMNQAADDDVFLQAAQAVALAMIGASVNTRVVSCNEAAEMIPLP